MTARTYAALAMIGLALVLVLGIGSVVRDAVQGFEQVTETLEDETL